MQSTPGPGAERQGLGVGRPLHMLLVSRHEPAKSMHWRFLGLEGWAWTGFHFLYQVHDTTEAKLEKNLFVTVLDIWRHHYMFH